MNFVYGYENLDSTWKMVLIILYLVIGLLLIIKGGDFFVDSASWIAERTGIPKLIIGATIVSLATTLPELLVSCFAAAEGAVSGTSSAVDIATGNAIGSVIANTGLIMSISIIFMPVKIDRKAFILKPIILLTSIALLFIFSIFGNLYVWEACILFVILAIFFADNIYSAIKETKTRTALVSANTSIDLPKVNVPVEQKVESKEDIASIEKVDSSTEKASKKKELWVNILKFVFGVAGIVVGAQFLVDNGTEFAVILGVPDKVIAITIIAIGTSLPELITTITAIIKKQSDLSVGNIIGANIIDLTLILSLCSFIYGGSLPIYKSTLYLDLPFCFAIVFVATVPALITKKLHRWQGVACLVLYIIYLTLSCVLTF